MSAHATIDRSVSTRFDDAIDKMERQPDGAFREVALGAEVRAMAMELRQSMADLRSIGASRIGSEDIPTATDELDAIIDVTASATGTILDACERLEATAADSTDDATNAVLTECITEIYQACNFQDLTGQRVTKVVATLRNIDRRVSAICSVFGLDANTEATPSAAAVERDPDDESHLLNGPALPDQAMSQDDIDRILAGLD